LRTPAVRDPGVFPAPDGRPDRHGGRPDARAACRTGPQPARQRGRHRRRPPHPRGARGAARRGGCGPHRRRPARSRGTAVAGCPVHRGVARGGRRAVAGVARALRSGPLLRGPADHRHRGGLEAAEGNRGVARGLGGSGHRPERPAPGASTSVTVPVLTDRALGRATLARQHLLRRSSTDALSMIGHLLGLQAQAPLAPYFALWTRIRNFRPYALSDLLESRAVVRIALMRGTVFAVSGADAHALRPWVQPVLDRGVDANKAHRIGLEGLDRSALVSVARELLAGTPMSQAELRPLLADRFPDQDPAALAHAVRCLLPLVQVPPRGLWGRAGQPRLAHLDEYVGPPPALPGPDRLILRY